MVLLASRFSLKVWDVSDLDLGRVAVSLNLACGRVRVNDIELSGSSDIGVSCGRMMVLASLRECSERV